MNKKRVESIDILRGIAIILMMAGHVGGVPPYVDKYIHMFHMPVWFFISGWFYKSSSQPLLKIAKEKARSLLVPYVIWGILEYPVWLFSNRHVTRSKVEPLVNLFTFNTNDVMPMAGALWFLTSLFFAELIYILVDKYIKKTWCKEISIFAIAVFGNLFTKLFDFRLPWAIDTSFVAIGFIELGHISKYNYDNGRFRTVFELKPIVCLILSAANMILCFANGSVNMRIGSYGIIPLFWVNALMAIIVYWNISSYIDRCIHSGILNNAKLGLENIGKNSIIYLCLNQLVIWLIKSMLNKTHIVFSTWGFKCLTVIIISLLILKAVEHLAMTTKLRLIFGK